MPPSTECINKQWYIAQLHKGTINKRSNMDESQMHYALTERKQIQKATYYMTPCTYFGKTKTIGKENRSLVVRRLESLFSNFFFILDSCQYNGS